eukprot:CAMPEP_0175372024 /NCGR_PEP_ID=MMETSP0095-20121207/22017_1 /TAXON_ID=311494 /ORGANISM="Alexandrium monilatum, Strain CCMP3105" /LENGTH=488 /DNA_ID=CAMNT_0016670205 /DNA_START=142 /DNA_END=1611 /DNA_ORIENTATION=-
MVAKAGEAPPAECTGGEGGSEAGGGDSGAFGGGSSSSIRKAKTPAPVSTKPFRPGVLGGDDDSCSLDDAGGECSSSEGQSSRVRLRSSRATGTKPVAPLASSVMASCRSGLIAVTGADSGSSPGSASPVSKSSLMGRSARSGQIWQDRTAGQGACAMLQPMSFSSPGGLCCFAAEVRVQATGGTQPKLTIPVQLWACGLLGLLAHGSDVAPSALQASLWSDLEAIGPEPRGSQRPEARGAAAARPAATVLLRSPSRTAAAPGTSRGCAQPPAPAALAGAAQRWCGLANAGARGRTSPTHVEAEVKAGFPGARVHVAGAAAEIAEAARGARQAVQHKVYLVGLGKPCPVARQEPVRRRPTRGRLLRQGGQGPLVPGFQVPPLAAQQRLQHELDLVLKLALGTGLRDLLQALLHKRPALVQRLHAKQLPPSLLQRPPNARARLRRARLLEGGALLVEEHAAASGPPVPLVRKAVTGSGSFSTKIDGTRFA